MKSKLISLIDNLEKAVSLRTLSMFRGQKIKDIDDANYRQERQKLESMINSLQDKSDFHTFKGYKEWLERG